MNCKLIICMLMALVSLNVHAIKRKSHVFIPDSRFTLRDIKNNTDRPVYMAINRAGAQTNVRQDIEIPSKGTVSLLEPLALQNISGTMLQTQKIEIVPSYNLDEVPDILMLNITKKERANDLFKRTVQIKADLIFIDPMQNDMEVNRLPAIQKEYVLLNEQRDLYLIDIILSGKDLQESKVQITQQIINH